MTRTMLTSRPLMVWGALALGLAALLAPSIAAPAYGAASEEGVPFDGTSSFAVVDDPAPFDLDAFSIAAWVKLQHTSGSQVFVNRGTAGGLFTMYLLDGNVRMLVEYADGQYTHANTPAPPANRWVHYLGTYDGQQIRLYVDGELVSTTAAAGRIPRSDARLYLGALAPDTRVLDGQLEDIRIWDRTLSADQAAQVARGDAAASLQEGLVAHWQSTNLDKEIWRGAFYGAPVATYRQEGEVVIADQKYPGYRGIWFTLGQFREYGDKYSGGLGTYTANHVPIAIHVPEVEKTFFVYGGSRGGERYLLALASYFDHRTGLVPRPTIVHDKQGIDDPHDNPSLTIDEHGHLWVFISGRGRSRPGFIYRSLEPYSTDAFERVYRGEFTYPQAWWVDGKGFFHLNTKYTRGRELYFETSEDGRTWNEPVKLAGMRGHYQVSNQFGERIITAFMRHPDGSVDRRTDLYYAETRDMGRTWHAVDGTPLELPLEEVKTPALVRNYEAEGRLVYINDTQLDADGNPVIFYVTSALYQPGPPGEPRYQTVARWDGETWHFSEVTRTTHNYDVGSIHIEDDVWRVFAPAETGPQRWGTGGEVAIWRSEDQGSSWTKERDVTRDSPTNHHYVRRPVNAHDDFYAYWADGNPDELSPSYLYFANKKGDRVWRLPYTMDEEFARPELLAR
jgi:hypothetical protein